MWGLGAKPESPLSGYALSLSVFLSSFPMLYIIASVLHVHLLCFSTSTLLCYFFAFCIMISWYKGEGTRIEGRRRRRKSSRELRKGKVEDKLVRHFLLLTVVCCLICFSFFYVHTFTFDDVYVCYVCVCVCVYGVGWGVRLCWYAAGCVWPDAVYLCDNKCPV